MPLQALGDGTRIHYTSVGNGLPTLVPCISSSIPYERSLPGEELTDGHRFIFVEVRGTARSEGANDDLSLDRVADDLEDLGTQLGLGRVAVMGQSSNGLVAARYAHKYPQSTEYAVLIATPVPGDETDLAAYWEAHADEDRRRVAAETRRAESESVDRDTPEGLIRMLKVDHTICGTTRTTI